MSGKHLNLVNEEELPKQVPEPERWHPIRRHLALRH